MYKALLGILQIKDYQDKPHRIWFTSLTNSVDSFNLHPNHHYVLSVIFLTTIDYINIGQGPVLPAYRITNISRLHPQHNFQSVLPALVQIRIKLGPNSNSHYTWCSFRFSCFPLDMLCFFFLKEKLLQHVK